MFPPVVVFYDGQDYWLADGFHRVKAAEQAMYKSIAVDLRYGTRREAVLHSVGANAIHGLRLTPADKRRAVVRLLSDSEWSKWSNVEIARQCAVSEKLVHNIKGELSSVSPRIDQADSDQQFGMDQQTVKDAKHLLEQQPVERYAQRGGMTCTIDTTNLGKVSIANREETTSATTSVNNKLDNASSKSLEPATLPVTLQPIPEVQVLPRHEPPTSFLTIPGRRHRTKEPDKKPEIISIQPKAKPFIVKPRQVEVGSIWKLGKSHMLYCGSSNDAKFQKLLPQTIELLLTVISERAHWIQLDPPARTVTELALISPYGGDRDLNLFRDLIQNAVDLYTDPGDAIALAYLPDPTILLLMEELDTHCYCAEPDPKRCEEALMTWTVAGKKMERG